MRSARKQGFSADPFYGRAGIFAYVGYIQTPNELKIEGKRRAHTSEYSEDSQSVGKAAAALACS